MKYKLNLIRTWLKKIAIALALNWANCWNMLNITQSAANRKFFRTYGMFRDYTPSFFCYKTLFIKKNLFRIRSSLYKNYISSRHHSGIYLSNNSLKNYSTPALQGMQEEKSLLSKTDKFSYYLTGLIEGDGTIVVPKTKRTSIGRLNYPSIQIVFNLKDLPLALLMQKELNYGSLARKKGVNAYVLTVNCYNGLLLVINLINGKMKTPKIYSLYNLIDWYNSNNSALSIKKKELDSSSVQSTPWLSGFIDADGHFLVRTTIISKNNYPKIQCRFELVQRQVDHKGHNNYEYLNIIAKYLFTEVKQTKLNTPNLQYRISTSGLKSNHALENYLAVFPLFSSKHLNYLDWLKVLVLFKLGKFNHKLNMKNVLEIKSNMNDKRTMFT